MKAIRNLKISQKLNLLLGGIFIIVMLSVGFFSLTKLRQQSQKSAEERMTTHLKDLNELVTFYINNLQKTEKSNIQNIHDILIERIDFNGQFDKKGQYHSLNLTAENEAKLESVLQGIAQFYNNEIVMYTWNGNQFIAKYSDTPLSMQINKTVSTTALNTIITNNYFFNGSIHEKEWKYEGYGKLMYNDNLIAIIKSHSKSNSFKNIKEVFYSHSYYTNGFPYLVDTEGNIIIHPEKEGNNIASGTIFQTLMETEQNFGWFDKEIEKIDVRNFFKYSPTLNGYIIANFNKSDYLSAIKESEKVVFTGIIIGLLLFLLVNRIISKSITRSLSQSVQFASEIAKGNLKTRLNINQKDEIGKLANALNTMQEKLKEIITSILMGSENMAAASNQVSSGSQQMAEGAIEQASSIEEISSSIEEMNANIEQNTENSAETEKIAGEMLNGVHEVAERAQKANDINQAVSEKIQIISDIAFQTNLLALNAAVEAARAGEQGRGFAVVAAEVRKLAESSKVAAEEIVSLAEQSYSLSSSAGEKLTEVLPIINKTANLVQEISASSLEQRSGSEQINNAVQQLNKVTQQNASGSEELATSAEELASQASQLQDVISYFNLEVKKNSSQETQRIKTPQKENKSYSLNNDKIKYSQEADKFDEDFMNF